MPDWLDAIPNLGVRRVPGVHAPKPAPPVGTLSVSGSVPMCGTNTASTQGEHLIERSMMLKNNPEHIEHREHGKLPRLYWEWRAMLKQTDAYKPPAGFDAARWLQLCADAGFLFTFFGKAAARVGWSTSDMFGVISNTPGGGGIVDRLQGNRMMYLSSNEIRWSGGGMNHSLALGSVPNARPFWELLP